MAENRVEANAHNAGCCPASNAIHGHINDFLVRTGLRSGVSELQLPCFTAVRAEIALMSGSAFAVTHHAFSSGAGRTSDGNGSHASTLKSPSYTKSVSWQHYRERRMSELKISPELLQISPEVQDALKNKKPVVALESTIISHGMPFPQNAQTAIEVEETIRKQGAVPATIAIIGGVMKVGLSKEEIELLGREGHNVTKVSRRDLPFVVAAGKNGATTVASTMIIAALAGIKVFATGGIGGVHRGAEHTFDISADLQELANTNVTVVCAGAKSILDLGLTTEYLETFGVPLIGYQTKALPAFFCRTSPFDVSIRLDSASEIARAMAVKWQSGLNGGLVVANPIPEQFAMPEHTINAAIDQAVAEAEAQGVIGKESTPFLLARVAELTGGDSLKSNIQLVFNNAILASEIAKEYQRLAG